MTTHISSGSELNAAAKFKVHLCGYLIKLGPSIQIFSASISSSIIRFEEKSLF